MNIDFEANDGEAETISEDEWVMKATSWLVIFNKNRCRVSSQPVELTQLLRRGQNTLQVSVLGSNEPKKMTVFFAAVELVETWGTNTIRRHVDEHGTIPATVMSNLVAERLKAAEADDELVIEDNSVSIDLSDPFTKSMFNVPVRGAKCTHLECFRTGDGRPRKRRTPPAATGPAATGQRRSGASWLRRTGTGARLKQST
jgi:hypothetical protein